MKFVHSKSPTRKNAVIQTFENFRVSAGISRGWYTNPDTSQLKPRVSLWADTYVEAQKDGSKVFQLGKTFILEMTPDEAEALGRDLIRGAEGARETQKKNEAENKG
jgi:hypothetical protein